MFSSEASAKLRHVTGREELASLPLHDRIALVIEVSGLGQEGFAKEIGATRETVSRWTNGHVGPGKDYRPKIAELATLYFKRPVSPDEFRVRPVKRSADEVTTQLLQTGQLLADATHALISLLAEQRAVVMTLSRLVSTLEQIEGAPEDHAG